MFVRIYLIKWTKNSAKNVYPSTPPTRQHFTKNWRKLYKIKIHIYSTTAVAERKKPSVKVQGKADYQWVFTENTAKILFDPLRLFYTFTEIIWIFVNKIRNVCGILSMRNYLKLSSYGYFLLPLDIHR
jgi:hypothetical protein